MMQFCVYGRLNDTSDRCMFSIKNQNKTRTYNFSSGESIPRCHIRRVRHLGHASLELNACSSVGVVVVVADVLVLFFF